MEALLEKMELNAVEQRQQAHLLLDALSAEKLSAVHGLLEVLVQPLTLEQSLAMAPVEQEELSYTTIASLRQADAEFERGEYVSHEEILREYGLTEEVAWAV